ncbi:hypothetical protein OP10G_1074 [Fimbriimonas ginsengisoli Gsoil 348]|uniref:Uncharacterized protein n=1 Tax=Fimbriimonas ginsengisoli Gsoil 348 TaxID=661478 RepID=A0A068NLZ3_FIMGI|nr:hypothetical protein OP10G_1074 [Fimbriimonas ginsengisoli Gsoil 348]
MGCGVLVVAAALVLAIGLRIRGKKMDQGEAERMRQVYVALSMYESSNDGIPAPSLASLAVSGVDPANFLATGDPYANTKAPAYPIDGSRPRAPRSSAYRISFSYAGAFPEIAKRLNRSDPLVGLLANEWIGKVSPTGDFGADVSGPIMRITMDGSVYQTADRGGPKPLGDAEDLFLRR